MIENKKNILNELKTNNKNGFKTKKIYIEKNFPSIYFLLIKFISENKLDNLNFKEQLFLFLNDMKEKPRCVICNKELTFKKSFNEGYPTFCSIGCMNKSETHIENVKNTNLKKFGGISPMSSTSVRKKIEQTNINRYGVSNIFEKKDFIQNKIKEKYGDEKITRTPFFKKILEEKYEEKYKNKEITKNGEKILYLCSVCKTTSKHNYNTFNYRNKNNINLCKKCVPDYQSMIENELELFLKTLNIKYKKHDRKVIKPKELDFLIPESKYAIEINGLYFHSDIFLKNNYHQNKWNRCTDIGISLLQIWEDEWKFKKEIILSIIKNKFKKDINKIYARNCIIKEIDNSIYKNFVEKNHIQGYTPSKIKIGLFYKEELVEVMSFSLNRKVTGSKYKSEGEYEMIRLCTKLNNVVIGGSEKLLKYFEKTYTPKKITSYSDIRFFNGDIYNKMGFEFEKITKPNYFYVKLGTTIRLNRFNFRKDILVKKGFDPNKTEKEIMKENKFIRVYDAGHRKFVKNYNI